MLRHSPRQHHKSPLAPPTLPHSSRYLPQSSRRPQVLLSQGGADAYQMSTDTGWTALMEASAAGSCPSIQVLVEEGGADVNMVMERADGDHPLLAAAAAGDCGSR
jgi:hypothetical protein